MREPSDRQRLGFPARDRLVSLHDLFLLVYLPAMALIAWLTPERAWPALCRIPDRITRLRRRSTQRRVDDLARQLGPGLADRAPAIRRGVSENAHLRNACYLRVLRPGGWRPRVRLEGRELIDTATSTKRGAILWVAPLTFGNLVTKMTLAEEGIRVSHLSLSIHGYSATRLGIRVFNPVATRAEERFLTDRLVMFRDARTDALKELTRRVQAGGVVSISANAAVASRALSAPLLGRDVVLATGAPLLARRTGAVLLPVFTVRMPDGSFVTRIERPLVQDTHAKRTDALRSAVDAYASLLETYLTRWPEQYSGFARGTPVGQRSTTT